MNDAQQEYLKSAWARNDTIPDIVAQMGVSRATVDRWRRKLNLPARWDTAAEPPTYFKRSVVEERLSIRALRQKYKTSTKTLRRWANDIGISLDNYKQPSLRKRAVPDDWHTVAPTMTIKQLESHYSMSHSLVRRMVRDTKVRVLKGKPGRPGIGRMGRARAVTDTRPRTELDAAAHHLRQRYKCVHRCDIKLYSENDPARKHITWGSVRGIANDGVGFYYVDSVGIVANETVVELARNMGWRSVYDDQIL